MIGISDISGMTPRNQAMYVGSIISDVFGISSPIFLPWGSKPMYVSDEFPNVNVLPEDEVEATSSFGTPIIGTFGFEAGEYNTYDKDGRVIKQKMNDWTLPYSCIIEFSRAKVITQTKTLGGSGTVKELFGLDDWEITIRGIALNDRIWNNQKSAHEIIDELVKWNNVCDSIPVVGNLFGRKNITNIVIKQLSIQPIEGRYNVIPFQMDVISDEPIELILP